MTKITVLTTDINVVSINNEDYICITDMLKAKDGDFFISDWLRNRNTLEYLGIWERLYNPGFNYGEFAIIRNQSGLNSFKISVKEYVEKTHAIGIQAKAGRYGGTYAHKDIAFEFGMWISAEFKIYLVREFQRLKEQELAPTGLECQARTVENKLPHPHRCYQTKPYPGRSHTTTSFPHLRQRSRCAERCHVRPHCPRMARCASRPERKRPRLCHGERIDLSLEHGESECRIHRRRTSSARKACPAEPDSYPADADTGRCKQEIPQVAAFTRMNR